MRLVDIQSNLVNKDTEGAVKSVRINNNNNNGLFTVYPPSGSSPVKNYNIKNEKLQYTPKKIELKSTI